MAKKTITKTTMQVKGAEFMGMSNEEKIEYLKPIKATMDKASTKESIVAIWKENYLTVGHRHLGRMLIGRSPEDFITTGRGN